MQETWTLHSRLSSVGKESKKKKYKDYSSDDSKKKKKSSKSSCQNPRSLHLTRRAAPRKLGHSLARKWTLEAESKENEEEEASEDSESGVASLALATAFVSKSIFNTEENDLTNTLLEKGL